MKALSIHTPWAWLFFERHWQHVPEDRRYMDEGGPQLRGPKDVENRYGSLAQAVRNLLKEKGPFPLLIHASKTRRPGDDDAARWFGLQHGPRGAVIGVVEVYEVRSRLWTPPGKSDEHRFSPWHMRMADGIYVRNASAFIYPVELRGMQGLFNVPRDVVAGELTKVQEART